MAKRSAQRTEGPRETTVGADGTAFPSDVAGRASEAVIAARRVERVARGGGVITLPLVTARTVAGARFTTGISVYPPGSGARRHVHNCDEQVTILAGRAEVEIEGTRMALGRYDTTYIPAGRMHSFATAAEAR